MRPALSLARDLEAKRHSATSRPAEKVMTWLTSFNCLLLFLIIFDEVGDLGPIFLDFLD